MGLKLSHSLTRTYKALGKEIQAESSNLVKQTIVDTHNVILTTSPIDTGLYRSNQFIKVGTSDNSETDNPNEANSRRSDANNISPISGGKLSTTYTFFNNLPYATSIEAGHSKQATAGVYHPAASFMLNYLKKKKLNIKVKVVK